MPDKKQPLVLDGKIVRIFLMQRESPLDRLPILWQVEAFNVDHAIKRLLEKEPWTEKREWELVEELDPEHDIGMLGRKLPLLPAGAIVVPASRLRH